MFLNKKSIKIILISTLLLSMGIQSMDAMARLGGGSRSSGFSSSSASNHSNSARAGGGNNVGMQRNDVVNSERQNNMPLSNQPTSNQATSQPTPSQFGLGHIAGAAVAGAAVGYMLNSHDNNHPMQNNGGANGSFGAGNSAQPPNSSFPWGTILMLLLGGLGLIWLYKRTTRLQPFVANIKEALNPAPSPSYQTALPIGSDSHAFEPEALIFFNALQDANNRGDVEFMKTYSVGEIQKALIDDIENRITPSITKFKFMTAKVLDMDTKDNESIASVRFTGMVDEGNNAFVPMDEAWHLIRQSGEWQLAGIEQI